MNERELLEMLKAVDQAREPRPEFARRLHEELFGVGSLAEIVPSHDARELGGPEVVEAVEVAELDAAPRRTTSRTVKRRIALVAIAASIAVAFGSIVVLARRGPSHPPTAVSKPSVEQACRTFNANAFSGLTRTQLLGDFNNSALADAATARSRTETLLAALRSFSADLEQAGVKDGATLGTITTSEGFATRALGLIDQNSLAAGADSLKEIGTRLDEVQRDLTTIGVARCL
jgi:hypothetical protein